MALKEQIETVFAEKIAPQLALHGGGATVSRIEGDTVWVRLEGGCAGCAWADDTFHGLIEKQLLELDGVNRVILDDSIDEETLDLARSLLRRRDPNELK